MKATAKQKIRKAATQATSWLSGRTAVMALMTLLSLLWFVVDWCADTTFRAMSDWMLWSVNLTAALVLLTPWMLSRRVWAQVLTVTLLDLLLLANLIYNRTYLTAIPYDSYAIASNMADFTSSVTGSLRLLDLGFLVILIGGAIWASRLPRPTGKRRLAPWLTWTAVMAAVSAVGIMARGGFYKAYDTLIQSCYYYTAGVPTYTVGGHILYTALDARRSGAALSPADSAAVRDWLAEHRALTLPAADSAAAPARQNLVLIICESLESWPIGARVDGKEVTPFLNSLIADSTTFYAPNMLTQVAAGHSIDAQLMFTTGLLPAVNGIYSMKYPQHEYPSLNKALAADRDARSLLFMSDKLITWNQGVIARSFGYDSILYRDNWHIDETIDRHLTDGSFLRQSVDAVRQGNLWPEGSPAMLTFITYTGHFPFILNKEQQDPAFDLSGAPLPPRLRDYLADVHYVDAQLRTVVDYLRSRSDYDRTAVVIVGDHQALGNERDALRRHSREAAALVSAGQYTPFIVLNAPKPGRNDRTFGQADVYPTLLDILGLRGAPLPQWLAGSPTPALWRGLGWSIFSDAHPGVAYSTVPHQAEGDTARVAAPVLRHLSGARRISDRIITHNLLAR